jgi:enterochelin esterase family protein
MIDAGYRSIPDRDHRALAGTLLGDTQCFQITQDHMDKFAYVGSFNASMGYPAGPGGYGGLLGDAERLARQIKAMYVSAGANENNIEARMIHDQLDDAGISHVYYVTPRNAQGWQTWRKSLYGMAPLLFRD